MNYKIYRFLLSSFTSTVTIKAINTDFEIPQNKKYFTPNVPVSNYLTLHGAAVEGRQCWHSVEYFQLFRKGSGEHQSRIHGCSRVRNISILF